MSFVQQYKKNKHSSCLDLWFWDNYSTYSHLWIGKCVSGLRIPDNYDKFMDKLIDEVIDIDYIYIKFYLTKKTIYSSHMNINCFIISSNTNELPLKLKESLIYSMFEIYEITDNMINNNLRVKNTINYYLKWNNSYSDQYFIKEIDNIK